MAQVSPVPFSSLVVQHNALVNARFELSTVELRLFLALLARVRREETGFTACQVPVREIMETTTSKSSYEKVRVMLKEFGKRSLLTEQLEPDGRRRKHPDFVVIPLLAYARYRQGEGLIEARFNELLHDYLLELRDNFTQAQLTELLKLKSASSYRIYWLLREYAAFGRRVISLAELKAMLGLSQEYDRFNNFRARILERARQELAHTDLPFTYETVKQGKEVTEIIFHFERPGPAASLTDVPAWAAAVLAAGVSAASLPAVQGHLEAGTYDEGYITYVLAKVREQVRLGKVQKEGGAVFRALRDGYLLPDYQKARPPAVTAAPAGRARVHPGQASARRRLQHDLDDARNSLQFTQTAPIYTEQTRPAALQQITLRIRQLEQELEAVGEK